MIGPGQVHSWIFGHVLAVLPHIGLVLFEFTFDRRGELRGALGERRQAPHGRQQEMKPIKLVHHGHVEGGRRGPFLLEPVDMEVVVVRSPVGQPVNEVGVAMIGKDHRPVAREQTVKLVIREGGKTRRLTKREIAVKRLVNDALKGDRKALLTLLNFEPREEDTPPIHQAGHKAHRALRRCARHMDDCLFIH